MYRNKADAWILRGLKYAAMKVAEMSPSCVEKEVLHLHEKMMCMGETNTKRLVMNKRVVMDKSNVFFN